MNRNYYNSNINILESDSETEELKKVTDSEESNEFIEKSNAEELFNQKEIWIRTYKKILNTLSIDKKSDYKKRVKKLKD